MNTLLMGLRGCGKSTIGRRLAELLDRPFIELDERVLETFDESTVHAVWSGQGQAAWREAEARVLADILDTDGQVVALGGGTPLVEAARLRIGHERRTGRAKVVYLRCDTDELARRLAREPGDRPSLTGADPVCEIETVLAEREPVYRQLADVEHNVAKVSPQQAARIIAKEVLETRNGGVPKSGA